MTGYNPTCANCHRCAKCRGEGTVDVVKYETDYKGKQHRVARRETCPSCRGVGGRVGVGKHNHR
ncbi:hypothetical protein GIY30_02225 [Gordonia sp. HNM0687]|uniref:Uncharacterized protein n=2 Tax=Gordonia TaxID=2053 RepID=A0A6L7GLA6_9ACTN|nr:MULTISPECIES: hypothetical protein [Gordonia]MCX2966862.1 hypothetical protein [Gordonia aquimaris]MXP20187.1 hypothetical protein [Gordonia mangrovi]UVF79206.1 hypothetical protein NWF22_05015 [Gordonia mangrovi]